jgi:hypothetical protein
MEVTKWIKERQQYTKTAFISYTPTHEWGSHALWDSTNQLRQKLEFPLCNHPNNPTPYMSQTNICFEQY